MIFLFERIILREVADLLGATPGVTADDIIVVDGYVRCKDVSGGILLTDQVMQMSIEEFSRKLLVPWLGRMGRLKVLRADLVELGVKF